MKPARARRAPGRGAPLRVRCISGPNLQLLGTREPAFYGTETLQSIHTRLVARGEALGAVVEVFQTNHEGDICDLVAGCRPAGIDGLLLNAGAYTHTSLAILDALLAVGLPCVEVHLSNPDTREAYRRRSRMAPACVGRVAGFRGESYLLALEGLVGVLRGG